MSTIKITPELLAEARATYVGKFTEELARAIIASADPGAAAVRRETCPTCGKAVNGYCLNRCFHADDVQASRSPVQPSPPPEPPKLPRLDELLTVLPLEVSAVRISKLRAAAQLDAAALLESARAEDKRRIAELEARVLEWVRNCGDVTAQLNGVFIPPADMKLREACRKRCRIEGPDAQALEYAITITERERDAATARVAELEKQLAETEEMRQDTHTEFVRLAKTQHAEHVCEPLSAEDLHGVATDMKFGIGARDLQFGFAVARLQRSKCAAAKPRPAKEEG